MGSTACCSLACCVLSLTQIPCAPNVLGHKRRSCQGAKILRHPKELASLTVRLTQRHPLLGGHHYEPGTRRCTDRLIATQDQRNTCYQYPPSANQPLSGHTSARSCDGAVCNQICRGGCSQGQAADQNARAVRQRLSMPPVYTLHDGAFVDGKARHQVITIAPSLIVTLGPDRTMAAPLPLRR